MAILKTPLDFLFIMLCLVGNINGYTPNLGHHAGNETKENKKPLEHCALSGLHTACQIHPWCNFTTEAAQYVLLCVLYSPRKGQ